MSRDGIDDDATEIVTGNGSSQPSKPVTPGGPARHPAGRVPGADTDISRDQDPSVADATEQVAAAPFTSPGSRQPERERRSTPVKGVARWPRKRWFPVVAVVFAVALATLVLVDRSARIPEEPARDQTAPFEQAMARAQTFLAAGTANELPAHLLGAVRSYPGNRSLEALLADATDYESLLYLQESRQLPSLARRRAEINFNYPSFENAAAREVDPAIPAADIVASMVRAEADWERGELVAAINTVRDINEGPGAGWAELRLRHYTWVVETYEQLTMTVGDPTYSKRLLGFYLGLDPLRDRFFWNRLAGDFASATQDLAAAEGELRSAARTWESYWDNGGITGALRQRADITELYRAQAEALAETQHHLALATALATRLGGGDVTGRLFPSTVRAEVARQRERLQALLAVNDDPVLAQRLRLLPEPVAGHTGEPDVLLTEHR